MDAHNYHGPVSGKKSNEWDSINWTWDGDLFTAERRNNNSLPSDCCKSKQLMFPIGSEIHPEASRISNCFSSGSDELLTLGSNDKGRKELEKRRRAIVIEDDELDNEEEAGSLNLKLGGQLYPVMEGDEEKLEGKSGKKTKIVGVSSNRAVCCQVQDCRADLSNAKDYHRRHKVCDVHSKAAKALVGNVMQRFCQQCSRFHVLQEFDEGKRSCRRRLAGHNRRRRKTHPENVANGASMNDEGGINYLLISLLRILTNVQSNSSDQTKDQDLLSHLMRNLASLAGATNERNTSGLLSAPPEQRNVGTSMGAPKEDSLRPTGNCLIPASEVTEKRMGRSDVEYGISQNPCAWQPHSLCCRKESSPINANASAKVKLNNIDLNNIYDDSQDGNQKLQNSDASANPGAASSGCPLWICHDPHKSSPGTSGNSGSTSSLSLSNSSGEAQSRTDRIVFKLFGKDPGDFPTALRKQILDWLSHSPTDIESYIKPGCIILTIYLRMDKSIWEELYCDLNSSLRKLLNASADSFWQTGWVYARVNDRVAFLFNGQVVLDTSLPVKSHRSCGISIVKPIAVCASERVQFLVKGVNLSRPTTRLLCALEGNYLVQGNCTDMMVGADSCMDHEDIQSLSFPCILPNVTGRGFIEVEDHGLSSNFFPFIVAEKDVCSEIRTLESNIEVAEMAGGFLQGTENLQAREQALEFLHEMGWLLHRSHLKFRVGSGVNLNLFPFQRFKWLIEFSIDQDWCAVVKKLLDVFFNGIVDVGQQSSLDIPLREVGILHQAVRRKCRSMVEVLLKYRPHGAFDKSGLQKKQDDRDYLFRPDAVGPGGLTPLHLVASLAGFENILDALIDDPGQVGIEAWKSACDSTGLTPNDYACLRGHYSYIHIVQKKISQKPGDGHVVLDIPGSLLDSSITQKLSDGHRSVKVASLQTEKSLRKPIQTHCRQCDQKLYYGNSGSSLAIYKPAMLSMVAIATICVCVALLFKSSPEVLYSFRPFRWELLKYGSI
ncbi:PREDICTED: squamosa promoter-binding-like protein 12 [Nicotiana attenuata]|uniref:Squamosa promoter-binding-like protein 12 n=1 Tax=Nicotiana attenuata TaxID=49451 RepID=A0A314KHV1_NICAT|nr:PREDICTED: squamosa promoter-binding-like protein 12 [Nicotiana attenuata]OIT28926.1 squamosa promoter-binding-like protein 12 [Nicotiana attenuata]